jgi:hypothetical protein
VTQDDAQPDPAQERIETELPPTDASGAWGPPGRLFGGAAAVLLAAVALCSSSDAFLLVVLLFYVSVGFLLLWLIRIIGAFITTRLRMPTAHLVRFLMVPIAFAAVWAASLAGVTTWLRFEAGKPWMDGAAAQVTAGGSTSDRWIGLWPAESIERVPGGMRFLVSGAGLFDQEGFAYSSDGSVEAIQKPDEDSFYTRIDDHWFLWTLSW